MKTINQTKSIIYLFFILPALLFTSCKKETSSDSSATTLPETISALKAVAVAAGTSSGDSVYVIGTCATNHHLDSLSATDLPATVTTYLSENYDGYTLEKAYSDKDASGNITGYVAIINYNGNPVGIKFDASGNFLKVLEQREGRDLDGRGWHDGGRFNDRDGRHRDTLALSSLPATITSYFTANYSQDTLIHAFVNRDSSYVVFSINNGAFATVFDSNGIFIKRVELQNHYNDVEAVDASALPAAITAYLTATYPGYVFKQAFSYAEDGILQGYIVGIDANGTKYAVAFDSAGSFIKVITIR